MDKNLEYKRHTLAHLLALAIRRDFPHALPTIGPAIENGFYYDFDFSGGPAPKDDDIKNIEKNMKKALSSWKNFSHKSVTADEARETFKDNLYKTELIDELEKAGEEITLYTVGEGHFEFTDLCRGGHCDSPSTDIDIDSFRLTSLAGAYWRGSEKNPMLTRIYGLAFNTKDELGAYLAQLEEAKKRDHRKIGQEMELFFIDEMVGKGLVMWLPKGNIIKSEIETFAIESERKAGYERVSTPHIAKEELFLTSGHLPYYKEDMYPPMEMDDGTYYLRAMNCPHHHRIFQHAPKSYRDFPIRLAEYGTVYRNERSGTLAGLLRVRGLDMNDAHIYCRKDQIKEEFKSVLELTMNHFKTFGLTDYWFRLSKWDPNRMDKYFDEPESWEHAESVIREVLVEMRVKFIEVDDEAAFYGPKVDVQFKSIIGREETMSTIQLDFIAKERFGLSYIGADGQKATDVFVIHRAPLSTHERFVAFLIEHFGGNFPLWLSPEQIKIIPVSEVHNAYAAQIYTELKAIGIRASLDTSNESMGKKIRNAKKDRLPYFVVVGDKEVEAKNVTLESRKGESVEMSLSRLGNHLITEIEAKIL
ncbi:MAG: threonine--tRNA ligase [Candidatus Pacebacteria bacterium]|nr:threonine--tRNA ligase [Candidatus Paceibacterota bacterium]MCF7857002.1 threonine--tRNA ligase [Candidatus Paceibacterota bacterium]